ncbi:DUF1553 domain-containing protein [Candidatus Poribacteria bacterium]|nr:DUF1553 domain-containing protein [Candidatus Poribacteria bacterium]
MKRVYLETPPRHRYMWLSVVMALAVLAAGIAAAASRDDLPRLPKVELATLTADVRSLIQAATGSSPVERTRAAEALARMGAPGSQGLTHLLGNSSEAVRWEAAAALAQSDLDTSRTALRAALRDSSWGVRSEAARSLGSIGDAQDNALLRAVATSDSSPPVRTAALRGIEQIRLRAHAPAKTIEARPPSETSAATTEMGSAKAPITSRSAPIRTPMLTPLAGPAPDIELAPRRDWQVNTPEAEAAAPESSRELATVSVDRMTPATNAPSADPMSQPRARTSVAKPAEFIPLPGSAAIAPTRPTAQHTDDEIDGTARRIDALVRARIDELGLEASPQADDAEFLRRISLDLTGMIPDPDEAASFIIGKTFSKRQRKIDELLAAPASLDRMSKVWTDWLIGAQDEHPQEWGRLRGWMRDALSRNAPYDAIARQLIASEGPSHIDGSASYLLRYDTDPVEIAARTSRFFLGLPMQCAQCHDHRTERWKQADFFGVAAFFSSMRRDPIYDESTPADASGQRRTLGVYLRDQQPQTVGIPGKGVSVPPTFLTGDSPALSPKQSPRAAYAAWITSPENPYFAKAAVNRIWSYFMGRGIVEPVDGFGDQHQPTHPELLDFLAKDFAAHRYDLRYLVRVLLNTETYQRSSQTTERNKDDDLYLTHALTRPLTAEQLFDSILSATNIESSEKRRQRDFESKKQAYMRQYRFLFGNDEDEAEVINKATISQALMMLNGEIVNEGSRRRSGTRLDRILTTATTRDRRVEAIYVSVLSRLPTPAERSYFKRYQDSSSYRDSDKCFEDLYWGLLNSAEFATNH